MIVIHVDILVKPECVTDFITATQINAQASRNEIGIAQFDLLHSQENPCSFLLVEAYRNAEAITRHKETPHYQQWSKTVLPYMARPRQSSKYEQI